MSKTPEEWLASRRERWAQAFELVERGEAHPRVVELVGLVERGMGILQIAEETGLATTTVGMWLRDPTQEQTRARKMKQARPCVDCGRPCGTDGGRVKNVKRCQACATAKQKAEAKWTPEAIKEAIRRWVEKHGRVPKAQEWHMGGYAHPDYLAGGWPAWNTVSGRFGTFNDGIRAAGFRPFREVGGHPRKPCTPEELAATARLVDEHGLEEAAQMLGLKPAGVNRRLKQHRGEAVNMAAPLTAETVIGREIERAEAKIEKLREEIAQHEETKERLRVAQKALANGKPS